MAPEVMEHTNGYDEKADIWSFGITALELGYGRAPYSKFPPMKVMLKTISEDPPTAEIYKDTSYTFKSSYHELIAKCLNRDPKKRPNAKKLLEHKFFKYAKDNKYIYDKIVVKLPPRPKNADQHVHVCKEKTLIDIAKVEKSKPVSVGSWSFDSEEWEKFKKKAMEEKEGINDEQKAREAAVSTSYETVTPKITIGGGSPDQAASPQSPLSPNSPPVADKRGGRFVVSDEDDVESDPTQHQQPSTSEVPHSRFSIADEE